MSDENNKEDETKNENPELLLDEFSNNVAGLKAFNQCISLGDMLNDKKNRLICIDVNNNLKVFNGEVIEDENSLNNFLPVSGIVTYFSYDKEKNQKYPYLAVASGYHLYIYKYLKAIKKIPIPNQIINSVEQYIYDLMAMGEIKAEQCLEKLELLSEKWNKKKEDFKEIIGEVDKKVLDNKNEPLSNMTQELLNLEDDKDKLKFLEENCNKIIKSYNYITALSSIYEDEIGKDSSSYLLVGSENNHIFIINPSENKIINKGKLPGTPFLILSDGIYSGEHKILVADRYCNIYILKKTKLEKKIIISHPLVSMLYSEDRIYLSTISKQYMSIKENGSLDFSIVQPNIITCMELANRENGEILILIATKDSELRIYDKKKLCYILQIGDNIFGMKFGKLGIKEDCLILCTYSGALLAKSFNPDIRAENLKIKKNELKDNNLKIEVPKKPPMYRDFVQREKEYKNEIQKKFITDLMKIKYKAMDTYVRILKKGNAPQNFNESKNMKISASLEGLGPNFKLNIIFNNYGKKPIYGAILMLEFNRKIFAFKQESIQLGILMPNIPMSYSLRFRNINENGASGNIKLVIVDKNEIIPLIQTNIKVPVSELDIL
jgi:Bardet-Biedl syndrome 1 protein